MVIGGTMNRIYTVAGARISRKRAICFLVAGLLLIASASALATAELDRSRATRLNSGAVSEALLSGTPASAAAQGGSQEEIRVTHVTIRRYGFEPDTITRPAGPFLLAIGNRAGTEALSLQLVSETNRPVYSTVLHRGKSRLGKLMDLQPGRYVLIEGSHPKWACTITITPR